MSILTKVLLVFVVLSIPPVIYFAAGALSVTEAWQNRVATLTKERDVERQAVELLKNGDRAAQLSPVKPPLPPKGNPGVAQLAAARDALVVGRSRMWYGSIPQTAVRDAEGSLTITVDTGPVVPPAIKKEEVKTHGIKDGTQLFLFSNPPANLLDKTKAWKSSFDPSTHKYLGHFVVTGFAVPAGDVPDNPFLPLKPVKPLTSAQWQAIKNGGAEVVFYDAMPSDDREAFLGLQPSEIRQLLFPPPPPAPPVNATDEERQRLAELRKEEEKRAELTIEQFLADGRNIDEFPNLKNDPVLGTYVEDGVDPKTGAKAKLFRRPLNRYDILFNDIDERIADLKSKRVVELEELGHAKSAVATFEEIKIKQTDRKSALMTELQTLDEEKALAEKHLAQLEAKVAELTRELTTQLATNKKLTEQIAGRKTAALPTGDATALAQ